MKKSILVLSALLTLVVSGVCLQSCSSEYDEYTTEEYGYYTEEEIAAIEALAEKYGLTIDVNEKFYGSKISIEEIEADMVGFASLLGKYEMIHEKDENGEITCVSRKKIDVPRIPRTVTRFVEGEGEWSGSTESACRNYNVSVKISWDVSQDLQSKMASGSATAYVKNLQTGQYESVGTGGVSCSFSGNSSIHFKGGVIAEKEIQDYENETTTLIKYSFSIMFGTVDTINKTGAFDITASQTETTTPW